MSFAYPTRRETITGHQPDPVLCDKALGLVQSLWPGTISGDALTIWSEQFLKIGDSRSIAPVLKFLAYRATSRPSVSDFMTEWHRRNRPRDPTHGTPSAVRCGCCDGTGWVYPDPEVRAVVACRACSRETWRPTRQ